jgi:hypothetical protein
MLINIIAFIVGIAALLLHVLVTVSYESDTFKLDIYKMLSVLYLLLTIIFIAKLDI